MSEYLGGSSDVRPFLARPAARPVGPTVVLDTHRTLAKSLGVMVPPATIVLCADGLERVRLREQTDGAPAYF